MKKLILAALGFSIAAGGVAVSQSQDSEQSNERGEAIQRSLEQKAVRIPASDLAAALQGVQNGQSEKRARVLPPKPDWKAARADLDRTTEEDNTASSSTNEPEIGDQRRVPTRRLGTPPPPPGLRALAAGQLKNVDRVEVDRVAIPVLIPAHPDIRDNIKVYGLDNSYTASAKLDVNAGLSISGTCHRIIGGDRNIVEFRKRIAKGPPRLAGVRADYFISRNDFGVDLSFSKFTCGYVMTIECDNPADDARCAEDEYITSLANSMLLINAERAGE